MKRFAAEGIKFPQRQLVLHMAPAEEERLRALAAAAPPAATEPTAQSLVLDRK